MNSKYELLKDYVHPFGATRAGVIGTKDEWKRVFPEIKDEDFDIKTDWFRKLPERIEVYVWGQWERNQYGNNYHYAVPLDFYIPSNKIPLIKQAIEDTLNEVPLWEMEDVKIIMEDSFNAGRSIFSAYTVKILPENCLYPTFESYIKSLNK